MGDYYTILDIISGLRPEYLKTKEMLNDLKKFLEVYVRSADIDFLLSPCDSPVENSLQTALSYRMVYSGVKKVKNGEGNVGRLIPHKAPVSVEKVGNIYVIPDQHVLVKDDILFSEAVDKILNSEFSKNISFSKSFGDFELRIDSNWISFGDSNESFTGHVSDDRYSIAPSQLDLLSYSIKKSELPDYHAEVIDKTLSLKRFK